MKSVMKYKLQSIVALTAAFAPGLSNAIGLGEMTLLSRIGETLMAEVPLLSTAAEAPQATCFTLKPVHGSDLPVVTAAKPRLVRRGDRYVVQLIGTKPISDPVYAIRLSAACGYDLERDYVLMPEAPLMLREAENPPPLAPPRKAGKLMEQVARDGQTLEDIADTLAPATLSERQRILADLIQANPNINANTPLADGDVIMVPAPKRAKRDREPASAVASVQGSRGSNMPAAPAPAKKDKTVAKVAAPRDNKDRLVLDMAPEDEKSRPKTASAPASLAEAEERLVKLETTLRLLTQEVAKMDEALDLVTKAIEAQNKLHLAQGAPAQPPAPAPAPTVKATSPGTPDNNPSSNHWLELLLSAGLGVGVSVGFAQYLGRRRRYPGEDQTPLALAGYRHEVEPTPRMAAAPSAPDESATETVAPAPPPAAPAAPAPLERQAPRHQETGAVELRTEDDHSVLELAEIMLSFGRLKGAADTLAVYIEETLPESFQPWSMLLDLYRRGAMRDEFEALAAKMRSRFNAKIPDWDQLTTPVSGLKTLEDYPHVAQKMLGIWGTQECIDYLFTLVHDTRAGQRNGFPLEVVEEIALLIHVLEVGYSLKRQA